MLIVWATRLGCPRFRGQPLDQILEEQIPGSGWSPRPSAVRSSLRRLNDVEERGSLHQVSGVSASTGGACTRPPVVVEESMRTFWMPSNVMEFQS